MSEIKLILEQFAQTVGAQIKGFSDKFESEIGAVRKMCEENADSIKAIPAPVHSLNQEDIAQAISASALSISEGLESKIAKAMETINEMGDRLNMLAKSFDEYQPPVPIQEIAEAVESRVNAAALVFDQSVKESQESIQALQDDAKSEIERVKAISAPPTGEEIQVMVASALTAEFEPIKASVESLSNEALDQAKSQVDELLLGLKVENGENGKDATQIEILPSIDPDKSYPRGTHATHNGGLFRAYQRTVGMVGWECIVNGVAGVSTAFEGKSLIIAIDLSDGTQTSIEKTIPVPEYKGVYEKGAQYLEGDSVSQAGGVWIAKSDNPEGSPGSCPGWQLAVKRGRDGRGLYEIARSAGFTGTEKELLPFILKGEAPDNVVRLKDGI